MLYCWIRPRFCTFPETLKPTCPMGLNEPVAALVHKCGCALCCSQTAHAPAVVASSCDTPGCLSLPQGPELGSIQHRCFLYYSPTSPGSWRFWLPRGLVNIILSVIIMDFELKWFLNPLIKTYSINILPVLEIGH